MKLKTFFEETFSYIDTAKMSPIDFKRITGVDWNKIINIINTYGKQEINIAAATDTEAAVNTDYAPEDEMMIGICKELGNVNNLTGHIFEVLCAIYFGMKYGKVHLDNKMNPEYDIITENKCVQCKWSSTSRSASFNSINKNYGMYKKEYEFCIMFGHKSKIEFFRGIDRNVLQLAANLIKLLLTSEYKSVVEIINDLRKSGTNVIKSFMRADIDPYEYSRTRGKGDKKIRKSSGSLLNYGINGTIDAGIFLRGKKDSFGNAVDGEKTYIYPKDRNGFIVSTELLRESCSGIETPDMAAAVRKFVDYFDSKSSFRSGIGKVIAQKKQRLPDPKAQNQINALRRLNTSEAKKTIKNTISKMNFNY